jgi:hypothetical protein
MELRICERPEPSHIHVPRPSRVTGRQAQMPEANVDDLCMMSAGKGDAHAPAGAD